MKSYRMKIYNLEKKINATEEKFRLLLNENQSLNLRYNELLEKYENLLKGHSGKVKTFEKSVQVSIHSEESFKLINNYYNNLYTGSTPLNHQYMEQTKQLNSVFLKEFKELKESDAKLRNKIENSVILARGRKQLQYCCPDRQKKWINSIIKAIIQTNIDEIPPSDVLSKLSNSISKLAKKALEKEKKDGEKKTSDEVVNGLVQDSNNTIDSIPQTSNKDTSKHQFLPTDQNEGNFVIQMPPPRVKEKYQLPRNSSSHQKENNNMGSIIYTDGNSYMCL